MLSPSLTHKWGCSRQEMADNPTGIPCCERSYGCAWFLTPSGQVLGVLPSGQPKEQFGPESMSLLV